MKLCASGAFLRCLRRRPAAFFSRCAFVENLRDAYKDSLSLSSLVGTPTDFPYAFFLVRKLRCTNNRANSFLDWLFTIVKLRRPQSTMRKSRPCLHGGRLWPPETRKPIRSWIGLPAPFIYPQLPISISVSARSGNGSSPVGNSFRL